MSTIRHAAHSKYAGLLPIEPSDEFFRPADLKNNRSPHWWPPLHKRASRALALFLTAFAGIAATLAWQLYGDEIIANAYRQLGWSTPLAVRNASNSIALTLPTAPPPGLKAMSLDFGPVRQNDDKVANTIATGQEQTTHSTGRTLAGIAEASPVKSSGITVESRADGALPPTVHLDLKPTEASAPQVLPERGKQSSAATARDPSCFPSASAVVQNHPGGWPSWTTRAPGHEGATCWYAAARPRGSDHRPRAMMPKEKGIVGTMENGLAASSLPRGRAGSWDGGLP
jgi:hypothetical protein